MYAAGAPPPPPAPKRTASGLQVDQLFENFTLSKKGSGGRSLVLIDRDVAGTANNNPLSFSKPTILFRIVELGLKGDTLSKRVYSTPTMLLTKAHLNAVVVGNDGSLWLRQPQPPSPAAKYWQISPDGKVLPAVTLSAGLRILRVSSNRIWVAKEDGDGLPTIRITTLSH